MHGPLGLISATNGSSAKSLTVLCAHSDVSNNNDNTLQGMELRGAEHCKTGKKETSPQLSLTCERVTLLQTGTAFTTMRHNLIWKHHLHMVRWWLCIALVATTSPVVYWCTSPDCSDKTKRHRQQASGFCCGTRHPTYNITIAAFRALLNI